MYTSLVHYEAACLWLKMLHLQACKLLLDAHAPQTMHTDVLHISNYLT